MIKKHQRRSIHVTYQRTSMKQLLKKTFKPTKENLNIQEKLSVLLIKLLTLLNYYSNQIEKLIAPVKIFLLT